ncbi:MAG: cupin domain-containing protein [Anaerolineales bacterium]|jgi:mannose-6-phosphate isomerase-like protein (cupin superfamily)
MDQRKYVFSTSETIRYRFPTHVNDLVMNRSEAETSEVFIVVLEPGEAVNLHIHNDLEQIFYMIQGTGVLRIGEDGSQQFPVKPGDVMRIPPHTLHSVLCDGKEPIVYLSIDCFMAGRPEAEPTWDAHVRVECAENGWDFDKVKLQK